jgi:hypothetical protein
MGMGRKWGCEGNWGLGMGAWRKIGMCLINNGAILKNYTKRQFKYRFY